MSDYSTLQCFFFAVSRWLSSEKDDCGTSVNLKVIPQHSGVKKEHSSNRHQKPNSTATPTHVSSPSLSIDPTQTIRHSPAILPPTLNFSTPLARSKNPPQNTLHTSPTTPQRTTEPIRAHGVTFAHEKGHGVAEGGGRDKSADDYDGDDFESDSDVEEGGSEVDSEEGEGQGSFGGGERSDAEADRHDDTFSDTQEMDSSITNQYLRQLR